MDNAQWPQEIMVKPIEEMIIPIKSADSIERKTIRAPQKDEQSLNCPRCNSINTKFCYYNNYSLTQPRYFCKTCKRYWTEGGSLRNIPVGGGSRRNKRSSNSHSSSSSSSSSSTSKCNQNHKINQPPQDLNYLAPNSTCNNTTTSQLSALEILSRGFNSFMPMSVPDPNGVVYNKNDGFPLVSEFKPTINFALDHDLTSSGYGNVEETNGRLLFPFENLKQVDHDHHHNNKDQQGEPTGYWAGMLGGGSW